MNDQRSDGDAIHWSINHPGYGSAVASVTYKDAMHYTPKGRKMIAAWLRKQAAIIEKIPKPRKGITFFPREVEYEAKGVYQRNTL